MDPSFWDELRRLLRKAKRRLKSETHPTRRRHLTKLVLEIECSLARRPGDLSRKLAEILIRAALGGLIDS